MVLVLFAINSDNKAGKTDAAAERSSMSPAGTPHPPAVAQAQKGDDKSAMIDSCGRQGQDVVERIDPETGNTSYVCIPRENPRPERPFGERTIKEGTWIVAPTREQYDKFTEILAQGDQQAALEYMATSPGMGIIKPGTVVHVVDTQIFSGLIKVRPRGQLTEVWVATEALEW